MNEENCVSDDLKRQAALFYNSTERERITPNTHQSSPMSWRFWEKRRLVVALLAFFGFFNIYALRVNLSVAVIAMTEPVEVELENGTIVYIPEFDWTPQTKGLVLSSFFYGYIVTQLPGGWLANKIGGNRMFAVGVGATSLLTLFTPPLAHVSTGLLVAVRVVEGLFEGVTYPCIHAVWSVWAPAGERARLATFAFSGSYLGTVVAMPACSLLAHYTGWPGIFYVFGIIGLVWTTVWWLVVRESPEKDPHITAAELKYIQESRGCRQGAREHPWRAILSSGPVWAIVAAHFSENWGFYTLLTYLPTFMQDAFQFETSQTGWASAVPYLAMALVLQVSGHAADALLALRLPTTIVRRAFTCGAFLAQTVFMLAAAYASSAAGCIVCLTVAVGLGGFAWSGFGVNHLDIASPHASVLMGVSNTVATLPGIVSPPLAGALVTHRAVEEWRIVLFISSAIYLLGAILYGALCSGEKQSWVLDEDSDASFDTDGASVTTTYDNKAMDRSSEM